MKKKVVVFASGNGSNAQKIIDRFENSEKIEVSAIFSNKAEAFVVERAKKHRIKCIIFSRKDFYEDAVVAKHLKEIKPDLIVLAGFLWLIPHEMTLEYKNKIINLHPALLPKYGGKGMYGMNVHKAIIENKETESGITIHYVNEKYDEGAIIFQDSVNIDGEDTPETLAEKIHQLEHKHFPEVIENLLK